MIFSLDKIHFMKIKPAFGILYSCKKELLADKENMVVRNQSTIESLNASITTHSATIATLKNTLTQENGIKAQLEAQVQNLQVPLTIIIFLN